MAITRQQYRDAMARLGAAVNIITTDGQGGGRGGFTASAVCSVTDDPPTLLVCTNRGSERNQQIKDNGLLCVNTLAAGHEGLSAIFASSNEDMATRFAEGRWHVLETGAPVLQDAVASFDCRLAQVVEVGTHSVFFAEVVAIATGPVDEGLIYFARAYHRIAQRAG